MILTQNDGTSRARICDYTSITGRDRALKGKAASGGVHAVFNARGDVVLDANRYAVQHSSNASRLTFCVQFRRVLERSRRGRDDSLKERVGLGNSCQVRLLEIIQLARGRRPGSISYGDRHLDEID